ncbi:hypothetical protein B296_00030865 [Ensete ventricosum]|uniref:Uncharacterized protein n=1 Tax=Ensete ventricosum TaxID=4639 RepID=A0A426YGX9_ENSVE|nr:hypothetical protein B296_00030865 [Ensete ventricosum]
MAEESARLDSTRVRKIVRVRLGGQGKLGQDLQKQPVAAPLVGTSIGAPLGSTDGSCTKASVRVVYNRTKIINADDALSRLGGMVSSRTLSILVPGALVDEIGIRLPDIMARRPVRRQRAPNGRSNIKRRWRSQVTVPAVFNLRIDRWMQVPGAFLFGDCVGTRDANNVFPLRQMRRTLPPPRESRFNADPTPSS